MRVPMLRSISGRVILGFAILIVAFGAITIQIVLNLSLLSTDLHIIRNGYVKLAFVAHDLEDRQRSLVSTLSDVPEDTDPQRVIRRVRALRSARAKLLVRARESYSGLRDLPRVSSGWMAQFQGHLNEFEAFEREVEPLYDTLLAAPPVRRGLVGSTEPRPAAEVRLARDAMEALTELRRRETRIRGRVELLAAWMERTVEDTARHLDENERRVRRWAIYLGLAGVFLGLLMTMWATFTLRPLRLLLDAARDIARGDYGRRISETGPTEVAEIAREFNVMVQAVEERERELVRSERLAAVGKMAAIITHEVRNPLSSIGLNTELLEEELAGLAGASGDEARGLCRAITTEVDRLADITEEYLSFARLPRPKLQLEQVNPLIENLAEFERDQLALRGATLVTELAQQLPAVQVDDAQIRQALLNLLRNGADAVAAAGGGRVIVRSQPGPAGGVDICVVDEGPGMSAEVVAKIFEPFFSTKEGGTGLGLALTQQIIHEHGGTLQVDSERGRGTTFVVRLPALTSNPDNPNTA